MEYSKYVDPFWGNKDINLIKPDGIAATWFFIKAQTGNTHPGACLPMSMVSIAPYNGAYPTGYGMNAPNSHGAPAKKYYKKVIMGFSRLHHSGTGAIGKYYNYFISCPGTCKSLNPRILYDVMSEYAKPGFYSVDYDSFKSDITVSAKGTIERHTFKNNEKRILVNFSMAGLDFSDRLTKPSFITVNVLSNNEAYGVAVMEDVPIYVHFIIRGDNITCKTFKNGQIQGCVLTETNISVGDDLGLLFDINNPDETVELTTGYSFIDKETAKKNAYEVYENGFHKTVQAANDRWNDALKNIFVDSDESDKRLFYSAYYHSIIKPCLIPGENPFTLQKKDSFCDFSTMWDIYKTQLPLLITLYPDKASIMLNSLLDIAEKFGFFPNALLLEGDVGNTEEKQARCLAFYTILDAFYRKIPGIDYKRALQLMKMHLDREINKPFFTQGCIKPNYTHTLDLAGACKCTAVLAEYFGMNDLARQMNESAGNWVNAYDKNTGLLKEGEYYEGGLWNYSFRLQHDMEKRIKIFGGKEKFIKNLDLFFGYGREPVKQPVDPKDREYMNLGFSLNSFEGFNNEPDMETPYAYIYADRHDRTCEVTRAGYKYMFTEGEGGIPGNNDSGGLSSCYMWNCIGIFPVTGQPLFLLGSPVYKKTVIAPNGGNEFTIRAENDPKNNIYVKEIYYNNKKLDRLYITVDEFIKGGELVFIMSKQK